MTPKEALEILDQVAGIPPLVRKDNRLAEEALKTLKEFIDKADEAKKD